MIQLDLSHDPYKNNFYIHTYTCYIGAEIATRLGICVISLKKGDDLDKRVGLGILANSQFI